MTKTKRDQRPFDIVKQYLPGLILNTILEIVGGDGQPYRESSFRSDLW